MKESSFETISHKTTRKSLCDHVGSFGTVPSPIFKECWTGNEEIGLFVFRYWCSDLII